MKKEVLVRSKVEEDPEVLKERQDLVKSMKPSELGNIGGLSDFPLPEKLDTLMRPSKRNLKSTKKKEESKRRWVTWELQLLSQIIHPQFKGLLIWDASCFSPLPPSRPKAKIKRMCFSGYLHYS